jgi:hypothetical protein
MKRISTYRCRLRVAVILAGLLAAAGIGLGRIEPAGQRAGLVQFDAVIELNMDKLSANWVVFARYWVCRDYYAVSVVWSEPHAQPVMSLEGLAVFSDPTSLRMDDAKFPHWAPTSTTYPKPLGERVPFQWGGGMYEAAEMRFAEAQAVSRRVYVSDLAGLKEAGRDTDQAIDVNVPETVGGVKRELARLKVLAKDDRIESMELFDNQQRQLCRIRYEYEQGTTVASMSKLVADLPVRPDRLGINTNVTLMRGANREETKTIRAVRDVNYVSHKGGRTCTVTYEGVVIGDQTLRLPVRVEVCNSEDGRLLRSARLLNFKHVHLDKAGVWDAARAFAGFSDEDRAWQRLADKYLSPSRRAAPIQVDPNDLAFARRLVAKYPVPEVLTPPRPARESSSDAQARSRGPGERARLAKERMDARVQELKELKQRSASTPKPPRMDVEPNDVRVIRQLRADYDKMLLPLTPEQKAKQRTEGGEIYRSIPQSEHEVFVLRDKLNQILRYHRVPTLPEDEPPPMDAHDRDLILRLEGHYEALGVQDDRGLGDRLKALHALTRLDKMLKDYDAFERHTVRYLQMLSDGGLTAMYMVGGCSNLQTLAEGGEYGKANKLMRQWADKSAAGNDADAIYRFVGGDLDGKANPWACVQLLDRFLRRPGLSPIERYEGLALRAITLNKIDKLLADPKTAERESRNAQAQWVLSSTRREELARRVEPALREAMSAWQSLGPARTSEARPYSTSRVSPRVQNLMDYPDATRLQETSAQLNQIVNERKIQMQTPARPREMQRPAPKRRRGG